MRCEELRATADGFEALDAEAEDHLAGCEACFSWLERRDGVIQALSVARPPAVQPSPTLAADVVTAWRATATLSAPVRAMLGLGAAVLLAAACAASILVVAAVGGTRLGEVVGLLGGELGSLLAPASALGGFATGQLIDHPGWLLGLAAVTALAAWAWRRIDLGMSAGMQVTS